MSSKTCRGPSATGPGFEACVGIRLAARECFEVHKADAAGANHACMCSAWASHGHRMASCTPHGIARASHRVRFTDVENPVGQSHADRASLGGGGAGAARAGQLQRMGHGQRHRHGAHV